MKIKTAIIGAGNMGKNHARIFTRISSLRAISDVIPEIGEPLAKKYKAKYYQNYLRMLDCERPQAVSVVVPTRLHKEIALECLKRKIPTLVEKPISDRIKDAQLMIKTAKKHKTFLMVGHIERFNPVILRLKQLLDEDRLGKIISLLAIRVGIAPPKTPQSSVILDLAIHDIDVFNFLLEKQPSEKTIISQKLHRQNISDSASILLKYGKTSAFIQTNWITPIKMRKLYLTGTKGFAKIDYLNQKLLVCNKAKIRNNRNYGGYTSIYVSKKEPLLMEAAFFLKNIGKNDLSLAEEAVEALKIAID